MSKSERKLHRTTLVLQTTSKNESNTQQCGLVTYLSSSFSQALPAATEIEGGKTL